MYKVFAGFFVVLCILAFGLVVGTIAHAISNSETVAYVAAAIGLIFGGYGYATTLLK